MRTKKEIYKSIRHGEYIPDNELLEMREHFLKLYELCLDLHPHFYTSFHVASIEFNRLDSICKARGL